ncbi:MAG: hypothetical protein JSV03_04930, partial [Planctomycetota bacterium]
MAKQNVTFIERHIDKFVIGVAGAVLLATSAFYLPYVSTPNKAELGYESYPPKEFYKQIKNEADTLRMRMKNAQPENAPEVPKIANIDFELSPYNASNLPLQLAQTFAPLNPAIPDTGDITKTSLGKIKLAQILPPTNLHITTGYALASIPQQQIIPMGTRSPTNDNTDQIIPQNYHWVTILAVINREEQRKLFEKTQYDSHVRELIVSGIELERQEMLPDETWSRGEIIQPYRPFIEDVIRETRLIERDGIYVVLANTQAQIDDYKNGIASREGQEQLLRPPFQEYLEKDPWAWSYQLPKTIEDFDIDLEEYAIEFPDEELLADSRKSVDRDSTRSDTRSRVGRRDTGGESSTDFTARKQAMDDLKEAEDALKNKEYLKALELLDAVISNSSALPVTVDKAETLRNDYSVEIQRAEIEARRKEEQEKIKEELTYGEDADPFWVNDISVIPGKTYRYRVRLLAFNQYFGRAGKLQDFQDAGKVIIDGQWSDWTDPATVKPDKYLFFTGMQRGSDQIAKIEIYQYINGDWKNG